MCTSPVSCNDEVKKAKAATKSREPTIFSKIIDKSIPADIIYEDNEVFFFIFFFIATGVYHCRVYHLDLNLRIKGITKWI